MMSDPFFYLWLVSTGYIVWREINIRRFRRWVEHTARRIDVRTRRLERQHDMAQDVVSAAQRGDLEGLTAHIKRLEREFNDERGISEPVAPPLPPPQHHGPWVVWTDKHTGEVMRFRDEGDVVLVDSLHSIHDPSRMSRAEFESRYGDSVRGVA